MQVDPIKPTLKAPVSKILKLKYDKLLSNVASEVNLRHYTKLTYLSLSDNKLSSVPTELGNLAALKVLYLSSNQLARVPAELGELTALTLLSLKSNNLRSVPKELGRAVQVGS